MRKLSRRMAILWALAAVALGLAGCGEEAAQRKAFIEFLQTRIIDKPGLHIPIMSADDIAKFGPYADHYRVMSDFHHRLDTAISQDLARAMQIGSPRSLQELVEHRDLLPILRTSMAAMQVELDKSEAEAGAARKALQQPPDLKAVYDVAYARMVTKPAAVFRELFPLMLNGLPVLEELANYIAEHRNVIEFRGDMPFTANAEVRAKLAALIQAAAQVAQASEEGKRKLRAMVEGN